ncbi:MAG: hypothetical protein IT299_07165 [Dehalococcoidia bacterium]|nr:hypothetical protein [Dehalococcoidia bacterium]
MTALAAPATPSRQAWSRLGLLALTLAMTLGALLLSLAWLWPQPPSRIVEVPLADLEVGVPLFIRPFDMGGSRGRPYGIWLVRSDENEVSAFWSAVPHPNACGVELAEFVPATRSATNAITRPVPTPPAPAAPWPDEGPLHVPEPQSVTGFRDPCHGIRYLLDGRRDFGPAFRDLDLFRATLENGTVRIDTSTRILGQCAGLNLFDYCSTAARTVTVRQRPGG